MTKKLLLIGLVLNCLSGLAQIKTDSIVRSYSCYYLRALADSNHFYTCTSLEKTGAFKSVIYRYDNDLNIIDSIDMSQTGRTNAISYNLFRFNKKIFTIVKENRDDDYSWSVHQIKGSSLTDSLSLGIDTVKRPFVTKLEEINPNILRIYISLRDTNNFMFTDTRVVDVDSNFNMLDYHNFKLNSQGIKSLSPFIDHIKVISDSLWIVYSSPAAFKVDPRSDSIISSKYLNNQIHSTYNLPGNRFLALGIVAAEPDKQQFPVPNAQHALGFYKIDKNFFISDTASFSSRAETTNPQFTLFSNERAYVPNSMIYDTSSIFLASHNIFNSIIKNTPQEGIIFVVKTDISGNEKWRFTWESGFNTASAVYGIVPTPDKGCIIVANYASIKDFISHLILIKLGPDGTISNVEVDAPENLVSFYPNPLKDKLHYNYLPEANGQYTLEIVDMNGKPVLETSLNEERGFIPVQLKTGFYIYQLKDEAGKVMQVGKLVAE